MEKLAFGFSCDDGLHTTNWRSDGFGWLYVSAEENGKPCRARFWADRSEINSFASAVLDQATNPRFPLETHWEDKQEGRTFHLKIFEDAASANLVVQLRINRCGATGGDLISCSFTTSKRNLRTFNAAMTDMIKERCQKATLRGL